MAHENEYADEDYWDYSVPCNPEDIPLKPCEGERYKTAVPDTLDLAFHADTL